VGGSLYLRMGFIESGLNFFAGINPLRGAMNVGTGSFWVN